MNGSAGDKTRRISLTRGNIRNSHVPVRRLRDLLPPDCFGAANIRNGSGKPVLIHLAGLDAAIETDVGRDAKTGRPRGHFRERAWIRKFFALHAAQPGDILEVQRMGTREYRFRIVSDKRARRRQDAPGFRVAEFFAGIGLVRLALEGNGFTTVFANDIDPDKQRMYQDNFPGEVFRLGDIHRLTASDVPDCDLATASFPCTDLSIAGAMNGIHSGESSAFGGLVKLLEEIGDRHAAVARSILPVRCAEVMRRAA